LNGQGKYEGTWDIAIDGNGTIGIGEIHLDKGMIYSLSPNPFRDELEINYGVFQTANVSIQIFDIRGALVAVLDQKELAPLKYKAVWKPEINLPKGVFWVALKLNDLQVHYLKVERL
jgi:hypothetical protein